MNKDISRGLFLILVFFQLGMFGFIVFAAVMANTFPAPSTYIQLSVAIMAFCMSYLYPHFKQKDERMKLIRQKGLEYAYFTILVYYIILLMILQFNLLTLSALDVLYILIALTICTVFICMVIAAKKY
ncbi:permease [Oceanobacillus sojae]|uniref:permease n=1 Tax=Oceanobacillus sojae TaxID=582851 RepID=UPI0020C998E5|nr:permease [Oceanobacillus sojae]